MNEQKKQDRSSFARPNPEFQLPQGVFSSLITEIQRAVAAEGYVIPTPIQEKCIPHLLKGRDILGCAQTGTGKTAAFVLPLLQRLTQAYIRPQRGTPRVLILAPTRELAAQIGASIQTYGKYLRITHTVIFGGVSQNRQVSAMKRGIDILVATPGRLLDLMEQGFVHLNKLEVFILDEGDRMLDMGFIPDIKRILTQVPNKRQTMFFSATMPQKMVNLAHAMVRDPVRVDIAPDKPTLDTIDQKVLFVGKKNKNELLVSILHDPEVRKAIVFTQMKHTANKVVKILEEAGIRSTAIHGNKSQTMRTKALDGFKKGRYRVLVATDVAARGLDVDDITHVINFDLPMEAETYVHRIGRTARAGARGHAVSLCCAEDRAYLREIERLLGREVPLETEHSFHCEESRHSQLPAPKNFGRNPRRPREQSGSNRSHSKPASRRHNRPNRTRQGRR